ncbi:hypothetical protein ACF3NG_00400 [Aerococcaceae bacterium WGS1372]
MAKQGFHIDEIYSYGLSNGYYQPFPTATNEWLAGNYYQQYLMPDAAHRFQYGSVISNQVNDVHPPLYYILFHTLSSIWPGEFSPLVGVSLNILSHLGTVLVIGVIIYLLTHNGLLALGTSLFWGLSIGGLSSMLFIRMYHLMGFLVVLLTYLLLVYVRNYSKWQYLLLIPIYITILAGSLTHYYFYIIACFLIVMTCLIFFISKAYAKGFAVGVIALGAVGGAWAFFPAIFTHITQSNRGVEVLTNANDGNLTENLLKYLNFIQEDLWADIPLVIFVAILLIIGTLLVYGSRRRLSKDTLLHSLILILPTGGYIVLVQDLSHYHTARYIYPIYPLIIMISSLTLYYSLRTIVNKKTATVVISLCITLTLALGFKSKVVDFQYHEQGQLNETLASLPNDNAMIFTQKRWQIAEYSVQLAQYEKVYPMVLVSEEPDALPVLQEDQVGEDLTVFVSNPDLEMGQLVQSIQEKYSLNAADVIYQTDDSTVYQFSN